MQGQRYTAARLVERVTGKPLGHADLINYLLGKMEPLYSSAPPPTAAAPAVDLGTLSAAEPSPASLAAVAAMAAADGAESSRQTPSAVDSSDQTSSAVAEGPAAAGELAETEPATEETLRKTDDATGTDEDTVTEETDWKLPGAEPAGIDAAFDAATLRTALVRSLTRLASSAT